MSLSKQQMIGAVGGGVFVVGALGLGWLLYSAWAGKVEAEEQLASGTETFERHMTAAVYPSQASIDSVKSNATSYAEWYDAALALAARGDKAFPTETPPIFKQRLQSEVRRMLDLPGGAAGKIAVPAFLFGFEQLLGEGGVLPKEDEVPALAVQLDTISRIVDLFAEAGVSEVKGIVRVNPDDKAKSSSTDEDGAPKARKSAAKEKDDANAPKQTMKSYQFVIAATPEAIVDTLNGLTSCERFTVVRNLAFKTSVDTIVERLAAAEKAKADEGAAKAAPRRRGRGAATAPVAENPVTQAALNRMITEPAVEEPLTVSFTVDVYDFGRPAPEAPAAEGETAEGEKPADAAAGEKPADGEKPAEEPAAEEKAADEKPAEDKADEDKKGDNE